MLLFSKEATFIKKGGYQIMRRMIPQKLIDAIKHLSPLADKIEYVGSQVKVNADVAVEGLTSKGIANTGSLANIGDIEATGTIDGKLKSGISITIDEEAPIEVEEYSIIYFSITSKVFR